MPTWHPHIVSDPEVMYGKPCIKGTRIPVDLILDKLAAGQTIEDLLEVYPQLTREDIQACLKYGADSVRNDIDMPHTKAAFANELMEALSEAKADARGEKKLQSARDFLKHG